MNVRAGLGMDGFIRRRPFNPTVREFAERGSHGDSYAASCKGLLVAKHLAEGCIKIQICSYPE